MQITNPIFHDELKARAYLEKQRWPDGPVCPHCGTRDNATALEGQKHRVGVYQCNNSECREQFTITVHTVMERSKVPLHKWLLATHIMCASKTGVSAHQLSRMLGLSYKTSWFLCHRIREAMKDTGGSPMGGPGGQVQVDETYTGNTSRRAKHYEPGIGKKHQVVALVEPGTGKARAFHVWQGKGMKSEVIRDMLFTNIDRKTTLVSDESKLYKYTGKAFADHQVVTHTYGRYVNKKGFTTNHVENFFGVFKRCMKAHIHCGEQHLNRYVAESAFRYSHRDVDDTARATEALKAMEGKRLVYQRPFSHN
jgi:transposase-like protein